jgi:methylmalonyl-CoA carboxyltransferase 12S subunit
MSSENQELGRILEAIDGLRGDVARLESRLDRLERGRRSRAEIEAEAWRDAGAIDRPAPIGVETVMAISAAVAAYLGKKPHIRAIRLLGSEAWAQEGRATIQAWYSVSSNPTR